jgi:hypothetical protein
VTGKTLREKNVKGETDAENIEEKNRRNVIRFSLYMCAHWKSEQDIYAGGVSVERDKRDEREERLQKMNFISRRRY